MINSRAEYVAYLDPKGNHSDYLRVVECEIKSPKVVCPDKSKKPLAYHKPKVREIVDRKKPIHDMIDGFYPAKITFRVANWTCPCKCEFRDPAFKYPVSQEYT